jgi:iron complex transport system substrate-binding protein
MNHRLRALPLAAASLVLLAGCSTPAPVATDSALSVVKLENCGVPVTFVKSPERVVTIKSTSTEMLLALGLGDRIVGTAFQDGPVPEEWATAAAGVPEISDFMPSEEAVLDLEPDLVYSGWESAFAADAAGERSELLGFGVATYVQPAACRSAQVPGKLDFDEIFREIGEVASIFRVDPAPLIEDQQATLDAITPDDRGLTALWYSSGTDTPYVGAGIGAPELVLETVGLTNVAGDIEQTWTSLGWESIVEADPDVIVLIDADWNTAQSKIDLLESNPATALLSAVQNDRYLILPFPAGEAGVRTVSAAADLAHDLAQLDLG